MVGSNDRCRVRLEECGSSYRNTGRPSSDLRADSKLCKLLSVSTLPASTVTRLNYVSSFDGEGMLEAYDCKVVLKNANGMTC